MFRFQIGPVLKQFLIVIVANFTLFHLGLTVAWLSPVMVKLRDVNQTVLPQPLTENEMAWVVSCSSISAVSGFAFTGYISRLYKFGRKNTIIIGCIPRLIACLLFIYTTKVWMLLLGRIIGGWADFIAISAGATYSSEIAGVRFAFTGYISRLYKFGRKNTIIIGCIPRLIACLLFIYTTKVWMLLLGRIIGGWADFIAISAGATYSSEIAGKEIRGGLGTVAQVLSAVGSMVMLCIGPFVSFYTTNLVTACIVFVTSLPILFLPESPYFLYSKGKPEEAKKLLTTLRGSETIARKELEEYSANNVKSINKKELFQDFVVIKTIGKVIFLSISTQLVGYNSVFFYLQTVFESTNTNVQDEVSSAVVGCVQLFACFCTILVTDRFGRKPVLVVSLICMAVGMIGLGTFFKLQTDNFSISGWLNYLPLISIILVIFCYNAGMGALVWTLVAELFDGPARAFGVSLGVGIASVFMFLTTRYVPSVINAVGPAGTYWFFGVWCVVTCLFIAGLIPETTGKAFSEIQKDMGRGLDSVQQPM